MAGFEIGEVPQDGYVRAGGHPLLNEIKAALDSLPEDKAIFVPCPQGQDLKKFRLSVEGTFRTGRFHDCGYRVHTSARVDRNMLAIWRRNSK
jgi:hypothetical protein